MFIAERQGFEPRVPRSTTVFKTAAIDHSATSPRLLFQKYFLLKALQRYDFILNKQIVYQFFCYKIFKSYFCIRIINERNKS